MSWALKWGYLSSCEGRRKGCLPLMERERRLLISSNKAVSVAIEMEEKERGQPNVG